MLIVTAWVEGDRDFVPDLQRVSSPTSAPHDDDGAPLENVHVGTTTRVGHLKKYQRMWVRPQKCFYGAGHGECPTPVVYDLCMVRDGLTSQQDEQ